MPSEIVILPVNKKDIAIVSSVPMVLHESTFAKLLVRVSRTLSPFLVLGINYPVAETAGNGLPH